MPWQHIRISRFGGPEVLELAEQPTLPDPGPDEVRIRVLAAGTGFTDTFIRRGRYPDFKGPLPFTPGYDLVGVVEQTGRDVTELRRGQVVADLCVIGGYAQYAIRPAHFLVAVPDGVDRAEAVCIPLAYLTAFQMLTRYRRLLPGATILVIGASGTVGTALLDLARHLGLKAIGTCSAATWLRSSASAQPRSTIAPATSSRPCAGSPQAARVALASMPPLMRLAARISTARSPASRPEGCSLATGRRPWRLVPKA